MLIEFSVGNYRSFKEPVTFSMVAANLVAKDKNLDANNVFAADKDLRLLRVLQYMEQMLVEKAILLEP